MYGTVLHMHAFEHGLLLAGMPWQSLLWRLLASSAKGRWRSPLPVPSPQSPRQVSMSMQVSPLSHAQHSVCMAECWACAVCWGTVMFCPETNSKLRNNVAVRNV